MSPVGRARGAAGAATTDDCGTTDTQTPSPRPRVIELLRKYIPDFMNWYDVPQQVKSVLSKIMLCRTSLLDAHVYQCPKCGSCTHLYNSCGDRHCPQCNGARRADWLEKTAELLLEGVPYFQVVFTLPNRFSPLILGNRRELYNLLFHSAWEALDELLRETGKFEPAALMVLHTWNQHLGHHPHLHALVPGGGPSLEGKSWVTSRHASHRKRRQPYLVDNVVLGRRFRKKFTDGFRRLVGSGKLHLEGDWAKLREPEELEAWLAEVAESDWNVFIEGPPKGHSEPQQLLKYLARYMMGGPLSDSRILADENDRVTFWARSKNKADGNRSRPFELSGKELVRRWSMHILPKGYVHSRRFGGYHGSKREDYLRRCRELLAIPDGRPIEAPERREPSPPRCPQCDVEMCCIQKQRRPSWKEVFERRLYADSRIYSPMHYIFSKGPPPFPHEPYG